MGTAVEPKKTGKILFFLGGVAFPPGAAAMYMRARRRRRCPHAHARELRSKTHHGPPVAPPDRVWCVLFRVSFAHVAMYYRCRGLRGRATDPKSVILVVPGGGISPVLAISGVQTPAPCELSPFGLLLEEKYFSPERQCRREHRAQKSIRKFLFSGHCSVLMGPSAHARTPP